MPEDERAGGLSELLSFDSMWSKGFAEQRWKEVTRPGALYRNIVEALKAERFDCLADAPNRVGRWQAVVDDATWAIALGLIRTAAVYAEGRGDTVSAFSKLANHWEDLGAGMDADWAYLGLIALLEGAAGGVRSPHTVCVPVAYSSGNGSQITGHIGCLVLEFIETPGCSRCGHSVKDAFATRFALETFGRSVRRAWEWASRDRLGWSVRWRLLEAWRPGSELAHVKPLTSVEGASASGAAARAFRLFWRSAQSERTRVAPAWQSEILVMCSVSESGPLAFGMVDAVPAKTEAALGASMDTIVVVDQNLQEVTETLGTTRAFEVTDILGAKPGPESDPLRVVRLL